MSAERGAGTVGKDNEAPRAAPDARALAALADSVKAWGRELGFGGVAIAGLDMAEPSRHLREWLADGRHGEMHYLARHAHLRADPGQLLPGALRAICVRLDYRPRGDGGDWVQGEARRLADGETAVISIYARGRDYHKVLRARLARLAARLGAVAGGFRFRVCTDTAPVFEVELARRGGLGWRGKHTLLPAREAGSMFFLGEILTDLPLPVDAPVEDHCGTCRRCLDACPTGAITAPYRLDARRCISYLTIEHASAIPEALRGAIGNRVYGCDDCQLACPWNRYAQVAGVADFDVRHGLDRATLVELFGWSEEQFRSRHAGSAILRIGYERWLRNLAVGLGNAPSSPQVVAALRARAGFPSALVREHVAWALRRHRAMPEQTPTRLA